MSQPMARSEKSPKRHVAEEISLENKKNLNRFLLLHMSKQSEKDQALFCILAVTHGTFTPTWHSEKPQIVAFAAFQREKLPHPTSRRLNGQKEVFLMRLVLF